MNARTITILIAALSMAADIGVTVGGLLPPTWGLIAGAVVAGLFAMVRVLHNVADGVSIKTLLSSPSSWATALVIVASFLSAVSGVVPVAYATGIAAFAAAMLGFARKLQTTLQPASGAMLIATPKGLGLGVIPSTAQQQSGKVDMYGTPTPPAGTDLGIRR